MNKQQVITTTHIMEIVKQAAERLKSQSKWQQEQTQYLLNAIDDYAGASALCRRTYSEMQVARDRLEEIYAELTEE